MTALPPDTTPQTLPDFKVQCSLFTTSRTCQDIDAQVGWKVGLSPPTCEACQKCGAPEHPDAVAVRDALIQKVLDHYSTADELVKAPPEVIKAMMTLHLDEGSVKSLMNHPDFDYALNRKERWAKVRSTWEMAESFVKSALSRGVFNKRVELTVKMKRIESCFGGEGKEPCPSLSFNPLAKRHFCNACGCGERPVAFLDGDPSQYTKLDYPYLECPRERPGFSNERRHQADGDGNR